MTAANDDRVRQRQHERAEANLALFERVMDQDWPAFRDSIGRSVGRLNDDFVGLREVVTASESARPGRQRVHDIWMSFITALLLALLFERLASRFLPRL